MTSELTYRGHESALNEARKRNGTHPDYQGTISCVKATKTGCYYVETKPVAEVLAENVGDYCPV